MNQALGGGMSSRLFQEVREKRGLAYSVYSYRVAFDDTGALGVYAGTTPERVHETLAVIDGELDRLVADGLPESRARRGQGPPQGLDRAVARDAARAGCTASAAASSRPNEVPSVDELVAEIDAITVDDVAPGHRAGLRRRHRGSSPSSARSTPTTSP